YKLALNLRTCFVRRPVSTCHWTCSAPVRYIYKLRFVQLPASAEGRRYQVSVRRNVQCQCLIRTQDRLASHPSPFPYSSPAPQEEIIPDLKVDESFYIRDVGGRWPPHLTPPWVVLPYKCVQRSEEIRLIPV